LERKNMRLSIFLPIVVVIPVWISSVRCEPVPSTERQWQETKDGDREHVLGNGVKDAADEPDVTQRQEEGKKDQGDTGKEFPINTNPGPPRYKRYTEQARETVNWITSNEKTLMILFTGGLAFVGFLQIVLLIFQIIYGWRAADAAKESARVADAALRLSRRAYVFIEECRLDFVGSRQSPTGTLLVTFVCKLRNSGYTPATLVEYVLEPYRGNSLPEPPPDFSHLRKTPTKQTTIRPQTSFTYRFPIDYEKWETARREGEATGTTYIYGAIFYADSFESRRETRFAAREISYAKNNLILEEQPGYTYST
jgi:hypothetical protein